MENRLSKRDNTATNECDQQGTSLIVLISLIDLRDTLPAMDPLRLLLIADLPLVRAGLASLFEDWVNGKVMGQCSSVDADEAIDIDYLDVIIWDVGWVQIESLPEWGETAVPIVALISSEEQAAILWNAGVRALIFRESDPEKLKAAVMAAAANLVSLEPELAQMEWITSNQTRLKSRETPTPREQEVLSLLAAGLTNRAIGHKLAISEHTVKFHVTSILAKLNAQSRTEAVVQATRLGFISL